MSATPSPAGRLWASDAAGLSAYLDEELEAAEREALDRRLAVEAPLREELEALRASRDLLRAAVVNAAGDGLQAPSQAFLAFGRRLSEVLPDEWPVAPALQPPRLRRALVLTAAALLLLCMLALAGEIVERLGGLPRCGWHLGKSGGAVRVLRAGRLLAPRDAGALRQGDQLRLEAQAEVSLHGPHSERLSGRGPLALVFEPGGSVFLERGKLQVEATAMVGSEIFRLRTPDGEVQGGTTAAGELRFEVEVK